MSDLLASDSRPPLFTLRKHTHPITSLQFIKTPLVTFKQITAAKTQAIQLKPYLVSVDESGVLIVWDLSTHRPVLQFQAHSSQIMSVRQMGVVDDIVDWSYFGLVLTHGRDHCIKFWRLFGPDGVMKEEMVYELPVNALNFSNVDIFDQLLVTPNTRDSEAFDVYDVSFLRSDGELDDRRLRRVLESVDIFKQIKGSEFDEIRASGDDDGDVNRSGKFGIIMKLLWTVENILFIGYESGHVAQVQLNLSSQSIKVVSVATHHFPDPVLSLTFDVTNNTVISTSIKPEIALHSIGSTRSSLITLDKGSGSGKIASVGFIDDRYVFASWNGAIKFYKLNKELLELEYESSFRKPKGMITGNLNIVGNLNENDDVKTKNAKITKPNALSITKGSELRRDIVLRNRRDAKVIENDFMAVGYSDGTVMMYTSS